VFACYRPFAVGKNSNKGIEFNYYLIHPQNTYGKELHPMPPCGV
jgi:hypothetical protein